jgi:hypothetical protein
VESYEMTLEAGFDIHRRIQWNSPTLSLLVSTPVYPDAPSSQAPYRIKDPAYMFNVLSASLAHPGIWALAVPQSGTSRTLAPAPASSLKSQLQQSPGPTAVSM